VIDLEEALAVVRGIPRGCTEETVDLAHALGRVLARAVLSPLDSPSFDKATMDGFAVGPDDDSPVYRIVETVAAGSLPSRGIHRGECARIMTGAALPAGAARVIRKEYVEERDGTVRSVRPETVPNVVLRGAGLRAGQELLAPRVLRAHDVGILAASGIARVEVASLPTVGIVSTGSEIRAAGAVLQPGQIYDSNGPQLAAQCAALRLPTQSFGIVRDEAEALRSSVTAALDACGCVLISGGVSVGDFDLVPRCLSELGATTLFHGVAVKPGKPTLFARRGDRIIFGMPGNPVSAFVIFELFVKPAVFRLMGLDWKPLEFNATLARPIRRRDTERVEFFPVSMKAGRAVPIALQGSWNLNALGDADGLVRIERGVAELPEGTETYVRPVWS
jgi:molybdenum cofactor synthesis domain-containing protein